MSSIYHPADLDKKQSFNDELSLFYKSIPRDAEIILGQGVNANVSAISPMCSDTLGPHRISNRNIQGNTY